MERIKKSTKDKLIFDTFMLFTQNTYDRVTFDEIEKATGLTRGAISYHFGTKDNLFMEVMEEYVFKRGSILQVPIRGNETCVLINFIKNFIKHCHEETERVKKFGITNFNKAYFNLESQGVFFYPNFINKVVQWLDVEKKVWESVIEMAIQNKEIKNDIDTKRFASVFAKLYLGDSYIGVFHTNGQDLDELEKDFMSVYNLMKSE